jgi:hypothetical protein
MTEAIPPTSPLAPTRVIVRASTNYLIRAAAKGIETFGSLRRMIILTAIGVANVQPIARSAVLTWRYASVDQVPPDQERQPIGIRDLAESLNIPLEVARDEVGALIEVGACVRAPGGVMIPAQAIRSPAIDGVHQANFESFCQMIEELKAINFDFEAVKRRTDIGSTIVLEPDFQASISGMAPRRLISRVTAVFYLSTAVGGAVPFGGDWLAGIVFAAIMSLNSAAITKHPEDAWLYARADTPPPDSLRRAASIEDVASQLCLSLDEVRREVDRLVAEARVLPVEGGYLASMSYMQSEASQTAALNMTRAFYRMIYDLSHLGVRL